MTFWGGNRGFMGQEIDLKYGSKGGGVGGGGGYIRWG
jgi:hypothetical protein